MKIFEHYSKMHEGSKLVILVDKEISSNETLRTILEDLTELIKISVDYVIKTNIDENSEITEEEIGGQNKKKKLIYINKSGLKDTDGKRVNSLDIETQNFKERIDEILSISKNSKLKNFLKISECLIKSGEIDRAHIIPFKPKNLIYELFSIEGVGTIIGKGFGEAEILEAQEKDISIIDGLLESNKNKGFLKPRDKSYLLKNSNNFKIAYVDSIPVGCVEIINIDSQTIELGALSVIESFLSYRIGVKLIKFVEDYAKENNKTIISVTNNPKLEAIYMKNGYIEDVNGIYKERLKKSPGKKLFYKKPN